MKPDKQQLIIIGLSVVMLCGFGIFQYIPMLFQRRAIHEEMARQEALSEVICSQNALLPELKQQEKQLEEAMASFAQKIPNNRQFAQLWQRIADVMNECKLSDQLVQPGKELKSDRLCSIPLTLECRGSLEQLFAFFRAMEDMDRLIRFEEVKFENDSDFNAVVKLNAKASVYYQSDDRGQS